MQELVKEVTVKINQEALTISHLTEDGHDGDTHERGGHQAKTKAKVLEESKLQLQKLKGDTKWVQLGIFQVGREASSPEGIGGIMEEIRQYFEEDSTTDEVQKKGKRTKRFE